jgi:hypothetical protein
MPLVAMKTTKRFGDSQEKMKRRVVGSRTRISSSSNIGDLNSPEVTISLGYSILLGNNY